MNSENKTKVFEIVKKIPQGKVAYYGQVAGLVGIPPLVVGWILSGMNVSEYDLIPWQRVVAKNGYISTLKLGEKGLLQQQLLISEGYDLINGDTVNMQKHLIALEDLVLTNNN